MWRRVPDPSPEPDLVVADLEAGYGAIRVLRGVSLRVSAGERIALIGANGAGKTTLLRSIAGLLRPSAGRLTYGGVDLRRVPAHRLVRLGVVLVPEGRQVFARQTVLENLQLGGRTRRDRGAVREDLDRVLEVFPILRARLGARAGDLSGGQQQMLALARAYMGAPRLLMIDELSLGLSPRAVDEVTDMVRSLTEGTAVSLLVVEQNAAIAVELTDRTYVMRNGAVVGEHESHTLANDKELILQYLG